MRGPKIGLRTILLIFLAIAIMMFDYRTPYLVRVRAVLSDIVSPIQYVVNWPVDIINWISDGIATHQQLVQQNASLQAQQALLNARLQKLIALQKENAQMRDLLASTPQTNTNKTMVAQILAVDTAAYLRQEVIDRGRRDGVYEGQAVIDHSGIVGQVVYVSGLTSRVMLLTDVKSSIPVEDTRNNIRGIVSGTAAANSLALLNIPNTADIKVGDNLVSSGLGLRYPVGYPVGTVSHIVRDPSLSFMQITVSPAAKISQTRLVLLIWPQRQKILDSAKKQLEQMQKLSTQNKQKIRGEA